jgi:hypothetical protein
MSCDDLSDLILFLNKENTSSIQIVVNDLKSIFLIGNDGEYDNIFVKKIHPLISKDNFVKVYDFLEKRF